MTQTPQPGSPAGSQPGADRPIGWGILATGKIAHAFAADLALVPDARLAAVGSRSAQSAQRFADQYGAARAHGSYADLVRDPEVDVIYIATPHALHLEHARLAFEAGKHVLCEKPLTLSVAQAEEMIALAQQHDRFLMEAMWMACHPRIRRLREDLRAGRFGSPHHVHAELGFRVPDDPTDRMLDPALGAGALLDMGIYPLTFAHLMLGEAEDLQATAVVNEHDIDMDIAFVGRYPAGAVATMHASMTSWSSRAAAIATDRGRIELDNFHSPSRVAFTAYAEDSTNDQSGLATPELLEGDEPVIGRGYGHEIVEVGRCLRAGLRQSPLVPHDQTLTLMRQMDALRAQVGVRYASDQP